MIEILGFQILLMVVGGLCAWRAGVSIAEGRHHPLYVATIVHSILAMTPVIMEWVWGTPTYRVFIHMRTVNDSEETTIIYYSYATVVCLVFLLFARLGYRRAGNKRFTYAVWNIRATSETNRLVMWFGLIFPVAWVFYGGDFGLWTRYGAILDVQAYEDSELFANVLYWSTYLAVLSGCGLIMIRRKRLEHHAVVMLFIFAALWLNGKRNIIVVTAAMLMIVLRSSGLATRRVFYAILVCLMVAFGAYSQWYQSTFRPALSALDTSYEMARMDFGRDSDVRMAILAEVEPGVRPILEARGQSFLFDLFFFVPRSVWPSKPRPYYHYVTSVALNEPLLPRPWGITTTILGESIANVGLAGFVLGPLIVIIIGILGFQPDNPFLTLLTTLICTFFLSIHLAGFVVLWTAWCVLTIREAFAKARGKKRRKQIFRPDLAEPQVAM